MAPANRGCMEIGANFTTTTHDDDRRTRRVTSISHGFQQNSANANHSSGSAANKYLTWKNCGVPPTRRPKPALCIRCTATRAIFHWNRQALCSCSTLRNDCQFVFLGEFIRSYLLFIQYSVLIEYKLKTAALCEWPNLDLHSTKVIPIAIQRTRLNDAEIQRK